jgi:hypothetical protein
VAKKKFSGATTMNNKQRAKWEKTRAKGMWRFVLLSGVFGFGGTMIIATSILDYFFSYNGFRFQDLYFKVPIYLISGLAFGLFIWFYGEYQYQKNSKSARD